ncbi:hypothetical protein [Cerasicoccus maritimus]|uniref:hypothetical protein n=1 Tax=Cerasicoccus maritimus TaxID=490089 RepID=UPI0028529CC6|nr:hypothetical protein [Cerasicoccus maritimus]
MTEDFSILERQKRLLAKEKAFLRESVPVEEIPQDRLIEQQIKEERDGITTYALPLIAAGVITMFFSFIAVNPAAMWGSCILGGALLALGVLIVTQRVQAVTRLKAELKALETETRP